MTFYDYIILLLSLFLLYDENYFLQLAMSTDNGVDAHRPILCMPIRNNKFEIIGKSLNNITLRNWSLQYQGDSSHIFV